MLFSSITFLYFFLPIVLALYGIASYKQDMTWKNLILCVMSCLFYAWGEPVYVFLMLMQVVIAYIFTYFMEKRRESVAGRTFYVLSVLIPFASLFYFKFSGFSGMFPIGISFSTFQITR